MRRPMNLSDAAGMPSPRSSQDPSPSSTARLSCSATRANLPALLELLDVFCERHGVDADSHHDLHLIVEEACVNVMTHAYPADAPGPLALEVALSASGGMKLLEATIEDQGRPFDPLTLPMPDQSGPLDDLPIGGLGVHLIRKLSARQCYRRDAERGNVLTLGMFLPLATND